jgi:hypothetical protein
MMQLRGLGLRFPRLSKLLRRKLPKAFIAAVHAEGLPSDSSYEVGCDDCGPTDIMISYAHKDIAAMRRLRAALQREGHTVWVDEGCLPAGSQFLSRIGDAILKCSVVIFLLSESSARSRYCRDEVAMAYLADKPVFPACIGSFDALNISLDPGTRLILSGTQWTFMTDSLNDPCPDRSTAWSLGMQSLDAAISDYLGVTDEPGEASPEPETDRSRPLALACRRFVHPNTPARGRSNTTLPILVNNEGMGGEASKLRRNKTVGFARSLDRSATNSRLTFWTRHFGAEKAIPWAKFEQAFRSDFENGADWKSLPNMDTAWLTDLIHRNIFLRSDVATAAAFQTFHNLGVEGSALPHENLFFTLLADMARVEVAMQRLVSMEGPISGEHRLRAILDLAESQSHLAVVQSLMGLTLSSDADARALAVVALGRLALNQRRKRLQGLAVPRRLDALVALPAVERCLTDADRVVRQASASALGAMCQRGSAAPLFHIWRNDPINAVRNAAHEALLRISEASIADNDGDGEGTAEVDPIVFNMDHSFALEAQIGDLQEEMKRLNENNTLGSRTSASRLSGVGPNGLRGLSRQVWRQASLPAPTSVRSRQPSNNVGGRPVPKAPIRVTSVPTPNIGAEPFSLAPPNVAEGRTSSSLLKLLAPVRQHSGSSPVGG